MSDHEYFCIHKDLFYIIQSTHQEDNMSFKMIQNEPNENNSQCYATDICDKKIFKTKSNSVNNTPRNTIQRMQHKIN